ncbi:MAG: hypothetical protein CHACPFDD_01662 [Phycisphaerae bacterium]|nr:hypothetical protein [Phycisphaerae bacterium]
MVALLRVAVHVTYFPSLWFNRLMCATGLWRRWNWVDDDVLIGAVPTRGDLRELAGMRVGAIVNMCEEFSGFAPELRALDMRQLYLPTLDYHSPSAARLREGVEFIERQIAEGRKVYVHCKAGRGRSATLVLCYLMRRYGLDPRSAQTRLKTARPHVNSRLSERQAVRDFARLLDPTLVCASGSNCAASR